MLSKNIMIKSSAVKNNRVYSFDCTVYDPYNVLKGRFVQLQITQAGVDESRLAESSFYRRESLSLVEKKIFYLLIKTDSNDNFYVYDIMKTKPLSGDFIKAKYKYRVSDTLYFDFQKTCGAFKRLNATNGGPWHKRHANDQYRTNLEDYTAAKMPYSPLPRPKLSTANMTNLSMPL